MIVAEKRKGTNTSIFVVLNSYKLIYSEKCCFTSLYRGNLKYVLQPTHELVVHCTCKQREHQLFQQCCAFFFFFKSFG